MSINLESYLGIFVKWTPNKSDISNLQVYDIIEDFPLCVIYDEGGNFPKDCEIIICNDGSEFDIIDDNGNSGINLLESINIIRLKNDFEVAYIEQIEKLRETGVVEILFGSIRYWC